MEIFEVHVSRTVFESRSITVEAVDWNNASINALNYLKSNNPVFVGDIQRECDPWRVEKIEKERENGNT